MNSTTTIPSTPAIQPDQLALFSVLLIVDSMHYIFAGLIAPLIAPPASSFYLMIIAALEVGIYAAITGRLRWQTFWQHRWFFLSIALLIGSGTILSYVAVFFINPGVASLLGKLGTIFTVFFGVVWLREKLNKWQLGGGVVAIIGAAVIVFHPGEFHLIGSLLVLIGNFLYALHAVIVKRYGSEMDFVEFFFWRIATTAAVIFLITVGSGRFVQPTPKARLMLIVAGTIDITFSRSLYYLTMRKLPVSIHAIVLTLSPAVAVLWTLLFFNTPPTLQQLFGSLLVLGGVLLVSLKR